MDPWPVSDDFAQLVRQVPISQLLMAADSSGITVSSRAPSKRSIISSRQAKIQEADRKEQETLLKLQQSEVEARHQASEYATLR